MNFRQFRLLALFVALVAATHTAAQSINDIPNLNSPQSINAETQKITNGINDKGQELNTAVLNLGQSINKLGYGPVREFGTDAGLAVKAKAQPYVDKVTDGLKEVQGVATKANAEVSGYVSAIASVIKEGEQTFISKVQSAFPPGLTNNQMFEQATSAFSQALGATSGSSSGLPTSLRTASNEYAKKVQSAPGYSKLSTDQGKSDIIRAVAAQLGTAFHLNTNDLHVPKSALPKSKRANLPKIDRTENDDGSNDDPFDDALQSFVDEVNAIYPSDLTPHALLQKLLSAFRKATGTTLPATRDAKTSKAAELDNATQQFMDKYKSRFTPSDFTDGSDFYETLSKELGFPSDEGSVQDDDSNVGASEPGASANVPENASGGVVASDGVHTVSIKRRMQHRRRALLN